MKETFLSCERVIQGILKSILKFHDKFKSIENYNKKKNSRIRLINKSKISCLFKKKYFF